MIHNLTGYTQVQLETAITEFRSLRETVERLHSNEVFVKRYRSIFLTQKNVGYTPQEENFHWNLNFAISLTAN